MARAKERQQYVRKEAFSLCCAFQTQNPRDPAYGDLAVLRPRQWGTLIRVNQGRRTTPTLCGGFFHSVLPVSFLYSYVPLIGSLSCSISFPHVSLTVVIRVWTDVSASPHPTLLHELNSTHSLLWRK